MRPVTCFEGPLVHCRDGAAMGKVEALGFARVLVCPSSGKILHLLRGRDEAVPEDVQITHTVAAPEGHFWCPGFVDTHVHAAQFQYTGTGTDLPLMQWLDHYAFPAERRLADLDVARPVYEGLVGTLLRFGTTTALYFGVLDVASCKLFVDVLRARGQRALVGKVSMDRNSPKDYCESTEQGLANAREFIEYVQQTDATEMGVRGLVKPVITPRFIPTCSPELLRGLGALAEEFGGLHIQSHISESLDEIEFVSQLHPGGVRDLDLFSAAQLLTRRTVMAHGVHLTRDEQAELGRLGSSLSHCPLSNFFFAHGVLDVLDVVESGRCQVGLGTDVAGGYSPSMLSSMRHAVVANSVVDMLRSSTCADGKSNSSNIDSNVHSDSSSDSSDREGDAKQSAEREDKRVRAVHHSGHLRLDFKDAFWLGTVGGARALDMGDCIGNLEPNKQFDALLVCAPRPLGEYEPHVELDHSLERFINLGDDRNVVGVWVNGRQVAG